MAEIQNISSWFKILKWESSPNFSSCHNLLYTDFNKQYYCNDELIKLEKNIIQSLKDKNTSSIRFMGEPGCGKTSFLYHLWKKSQNDSSSVINNYFFFIFHADRADNPKEYRELTQYYILKAWDEYYCVCNQSDTFRRINSQDISDKKKLDLLSDFYKENKAAFNKTLIFIIDDIDLLKDDMAFNIASAVKKDLELASVILLVSIRPTTYRHYNSETKKFFNEFFPIVYSYPSVSLYEIISYRVSTVSITGRNGKNPFSKELCDEILQMLLDGNKRLALANLKAILENNLPKKIRTTHSEEFIQNYIQQAAINTFINNSLLPNVHEKYFRSVANYPLPFDIIQICQYVKDKSIILGALNQIAIQRSNKSSNLLNLERDIQIRESDLDYSVNKLCQTNILVKEGKNYIDLTEPGKVLAIYSTREHYNERCKELLPQIDVSETYWEYHNRKIKYEVIVDTYLTWKKQQGY